ncbi:MAG: gamma-glutamyltransferase [Oscillatoriales cyanobacterium]|nr:MAG: gamma-glutamyltransferase [Oscillatoriales cyanobacterium]
MFSKLSDKVRIYTFFLAVILLGGCQQQLQPNLQQQRSKQVMAVSAHPLASAVGLSVLQQGGNAVDAAAATALAISVVEPFSAGIGGDFRERSPKGATRDMYLDKQGKVRARASRDGHLAAGIPGTVAGLYTVHREYGKLPWAQVVAPAIALAQKGFPVSSRFTKATLQHKDAINKNRAARDIFTRSDVLYQPGEVLVQRDLARTLRQIAQNPQSFYRGDIARAIAADMAKNGGIITLEDLKNYTPIWRNPICGKFRTYELCAMSPPSSGGVHLLQILNILGDTDLKSLGRQSPDTLHLLAESMRIVYADRAEYLGDPDFVSVPVKALTSRNYGKFRRSQIQMSKAKPSREVKAVDAQTLSRFAYESPETTHLTVVDKERNVVSLTFTVNGRFGAGVVAAGTGILLNNEMDDFAAAPGVPNLFGLVGGEANAIAPLKTPLSSMTPIIVTQNGKFRLAAGAPGGSTIITTVLQIVLNVLVYEMNVGDAVSAPRIHHQWQPDRLMVERGGFEAGTLEELRRRGHQIFERDGWGNANAIVLTGDGWLEGAADPRGEGEAKGF